MIPAPIISEALLSAMINTLYPPTVVNASTGITVHDGPSAETVSPIQEVFGGLRGARSGLMVAPTGEVVQETDVFW